MKTKIFLMIGAVAVSFMALILTAASPADADQSQRDRDVAPSQGPNALGDLRRATQVIGADIVDTQGKKFGHIKDLGLDLQNGRVAAVIVATGGTLGMREIIEAVPPQSLTCESASGKLQFRADRQGIETAPEFELSRWDESTGNAQILAIYQRFGAQPYFARIGAAPVNTDASAQRGQDAHSYSFNGENALPRLGTIVRADKLIGSSTWNLQGSKLAHVENFVVDLPAGRLVEVVLSYGGIWGMGAELTAVPPQAFRLSKDNAQLGLDTTRDELKSAPRFKSSEWSRANEPDRIKDVYSFYHVNPYFMMRAINNENGAQNVRERSDDSTSSIEQANKSDLKITAQIHDAIEADENLSADAKNVKIVTSNGKVTLIGPVASDDEKRRIGDAAAKIVTVQAVDNQLEVHPTPVSTTPAPP